MRLLIVEDDHFYAQRITENLQDYSVEGVIVNSAHEALAADLSAYDGAVVDLMLPNDPALSKISVEECRAGFLTGVAVARRFLQAKPNLRIVLWSADDQNQEASQWANDHGFPFIGKNEGMGGLRAALYRAKLLPGMRPPLAFIVHGHDTPLVMELKNYLQNVLKWQEPIVLREQASLGKTLIEKFEHFARKVDFVFVLLTPDDKVIASGTNAEKRRSRQNVIFELGFFYGSFDRRSGKILLLHKGEVELPSDISGIVWIDISAGIEAAGETIRKEVGIG